MASVKVLFRFHNLFGLMFEKLLNVIIIFNIYGDYNGVTNVSDFNNNSALPPSYHIKPILSSTNNNMLTNNEDSDDSSSTRDCFCDRNCNEK